MLYMYLVEFINNLRLNYYWVWNFLFKKDIEYCFDYVFVFFLKTVLRFKGDRDFNKKNIL